MAYRLARHQELSQVVTVLGGVAARVEGDLVPSPGVVMLTGGDAHATCQVAGESVAIPPGATESVRAPSGAQRVTCAAALRLPFETSVQVEPEGTAQVTVTLAVDQAAVEALEHAQTMRTLRRTGVGLALAGGAGALGYLYGPQFARRNLDTALLGHMAWGAPLAAGLAGLAFGSDLSEGEAAAAFGVDLPLAGAALGLALVPRLILRDFEATRDLLGPAAGFLLGAAVGQLDDFTPWNWDSKTGPRTRNRALAALGLGLASAWLFRNNWGPFQRADSDLLGIGFTAAFTVLGGLAGAATAGTREADQGLGIALVCALLPLGFIALDLAEEPMLIFAADLGGLALGSALVAAFGPLFED